MAALTTVAHYITAARRLLLDETEPYRYSDVDVVDALNYGHLEARRLRPDLFLPDTDTVTSYSSASTGTTVVMDMQYRMSLVFYICGHMQLIDTEDTSDARAAAFMARFVTQMTSLNT